MRWYCNVTEWRWHNFINFKNSEKRSHNNNKLLNQYQDKKWCRFQKNQKVINKKSGLVCKKIFKEFGVANVNKEKRCIILRALAILLKTNSEFTDEYRAMYI